jgi:hypothetical protein
MAKTGGREVREVATTILLQIAVPLRLWRTLRRKMKLARSATRKTIPSVALWWFVFTPNLFSTVFNKFQRHRIHAIPQARRLRTIIKYMAQMRVA